MMGNKTLYSGTKEVIYKKYNNYLELGLTTKLDIYIRTLVS